MKYLERRIAYLLRRADEIQDKAVDIYGAPLEVYQSWCKYLRLAGELMMLAKKLKEETK